MNEFLHSLNPATALGDLEDLAHVNVVHFGTVLVDSYFPFCDVTIINIFTSFVDPDSVYGSRGIK